VGVGTAWHWSLSGRDDVNSGLEQKPSTHKVARFSLRARLLVLASLVLLISLGLVGIALNSAFYRSAETALQERLESYVYLVLAATEINSEGRLVVDDELGDPRLSRPGSGIYAYMHGHQDRWISPSTLGLDLPELQATSAGETRFLLPREKANWFIYQYGVAWEVAGENVLPVTVSVLADPAGIDGEVAAFRRGLWTSLGAAGLLLVIAQLILFGLGLRPLRHIATDVERVETGRSEYLEGRYPRELEPLVRNVNRLLATEKANQTRYRNALDSLAHSLKTPLAAIRAGLTRLQPEQASDLQQSVDDMHHLVTTRLQRASASTRRTLGTPVPVMAQAQRVLASLDKVHSQKMIEVDVSIPEDLCFNGEERDLLELLGNLLDNAYKYGRSRVRLCAGMIEGASSRPGTWIRVDDDGPGIDADRRTQLLQRGVRGDERVEGHGLGLSIVVELVNTYDGSISIGRSDFGGARIEIELPPN
jgi:two-component system sensor histidine kinase PhoQ